MLKKEFVDRTKKLAEILVDVKSLFIVGKGVCFPMAREAALKLKETSYIHAEAVGAGDLKHGPIALIDAQNPLSTKSKS